MATPRVSDEPATQRQYATQLALSAALAQALRTLWASLNPLASDASWDAFAASVRAVVPQYGQVASVTALDNYRAARSAAGVTTAPKLPKITPVPASKIDAGLAWARRAAADTEREMAADLAKFEAAILKRAEAAMQKALMDEARETTIEAAEGDDKALGYRRVPRPGACAWCLALATRKTTRRGLAKDFKRYGTPGVLGGDEHWGVYKSRASAGQTPVGSKAINRFHNNCVVPGTLVAGPDTQTGYRRHYEGEIVTLVTAAGHELSITPKHPVLTDRGWILAGDLNVGDHLVSARSGERNVVSGPDVNHVPARIEDVVGSLGMMSAATRLRVPGSPEQFHGDGFASKVDVVAMHDLFGMEVQPAFVHPCAELDLHRRTLQRSFAGFAFASLRELQPLAHGPLASSRGSISGTSQLLSLGLTQSIHADLIGLTGAPDLDALFGQPARHDITGYAVGLGQRKDAFSLGVTTGKIVGRGDSSRRRSNVARKFDPPALDGDPKALGIFAQRGADLLERLAGSVHLDRLVDKRVGQYHGDVLNLETTEGWYSANGITVSNCHCVMEPIFSTDFVAPEWLQEVDNLYADTDDFNHFRRVIEARRRGEPAPADPAPLLPAPAASEVQVAAIANLLGGIDAAMRRVA